MARPPPLQTPHTSRPGSAASNDRWSATSPTSAYASMATPSPAPAYVALVAATQMVNDHRLEAFSDEQAGMMGAAADGQGNQAAFSEEALALLNSFLDHTLFSVLATARSGKLKRLRPAITDVLKPRLAREAIASADEELRELLEGEEEEDSDAEGGANNHQRNDKAPTSPSSGGSDFDLALTWRRTRLRIMVYTRLGDLEDEDEDRFLDDDEDFHHAKADAAERARGRGDADSDVIADLGLVSPAAAIFLTSVIEYLAEQTIVVAGQAALRRLKKTSPLLQQHGGEAPPPASNLTVLDLDMEKVALNPTLGRLWRTWRKRTRGNSSGMTPATPHSPGRRGYYGSIGSVAGESSAWSEMGSRRPSVAVTDKTRYNDDDDVPDTREHSELEMAANIALPLPGGDDDQERDVREIEVPGLARQIVDDEGALEEEEYEVIDERKRRVSTSEKPEAPMERPTLKRLRSSSAPNIVLPKSWLDYFRARPADESAVDGEEDNEEQRGGLIAGAAAAVSSVITAAIGSRGNATDDEQEEEFEEAVETLPEEEAQNAKSEPSTAGPESDDRAGENEATPAPKPPLSDMERALLAAENHVRGVSAAPEKAQPLTAASEKPKDTPVSADAEQPAGDEVVSRPTSITAKPAPPKVSKCAEAPPSNDLSDTATGTADAAPIEKPAKVGGKPAERMKENLAMTAAAAAAAGTAGLVASKHKHTPSDVGPEVPAKDVKSPSPAVPPKEFEAGRTPSRPAEQTWSALQVQTSTPASRQSPVSNPSPVVDDEYDPFSSAYSTNSYQKGPPSRSSSNQYDESAIGVARSSDRAIPAPRTPSPPSKELQKNQDGIQDQAQQGVSAARNVNGATAPSAYPAFGPSGPQDNTDQRPQSAHRGDSGLTGHRNVTQFASAPRQESPQPPPKGPSRADGARGAQEQQPRAAATLQAVGTPSSQGQDRSDKRTSGGSTGSKPRLSDEQKNAAASRPGSRRTRSATSGSGENGLTPRPVDSSRGSSDSKRRDFEDLLKNGENETMKYTLTPSRVMDESPTSVVSTVRPVQVERQPSSQTPATTSSQTLRNSPPRATSARQDTTEASRTAGPTHTTAPATSQVTYRTTPTPKPTRKTSALSGARIPGSPPVDASASASASASVSTSAPASASTAFRDPTASSHRDFAAAATTTAASALSTTARANAARGANASAQSTPPALPSKRKGFSWTAREPRVKQESMRDFADFIRTTGPDREISIIPIVARSSSRASGSMLSGLTSHRGGANRSSGATNLDDSANNSNGNSYTAGSAGAASKRKSAPMIARDPSVRNDESRDLIDFIRQGPPGSGGPTNSPNPRLVAPFNSMNGMGVRGGRDSDELASTVSVSSNRNSNAASTNSRTNLLAAQPQPPQQEPAIKKTRRRVKDPYAIDMSDDDEDLLTALPGAKRAKGRDEESLVDFLRNSEPPSGNAPQALNVGIGAGARQTNGRPVGAAAATNGAANGRVALPITTNTNGAGTVATAVQQQQQQPGGAEARVGATRAAREENYQTTSELADFLRNSGPPMETVPIARKGSKNNAGGRFWKRKAAVDV